MRVSNFFDFETPISERSVSYLISTLSTKSGEKVLIGLKTSLIWLNYVWNLVSG
jgi:hypothetical protein